MAKRGKGLLLYLAAVAWSVATTFNLRHLKVHGPNGIKRWECNFAAVWGQMSSGSGHTPLQQTMGILGVPVAATKNYASAERGLGEWWRTQLEKSCLEAGKEEKQLAEERNDYHQGVPAITVIVDGSWSKKSHITPSLVLP